MPSEDEQQEPTQKTQPKKGRPIDITVPKREDIERLLSKAAQPDK
ncbi:MAG: hypothetical protein ACR2LK_08345 [Solirubrobacteraceae bacterium]